MEIEMGVFVEGGKLENPKKKRRESITEDRVYGMWRHVYKIVSYGCLFNT